MTRGKGDEVTEPIGSFAQAQALAAQYLPSDWYVSPDGYEFGGGYIVFGARIAFWYPTLLGGESHVFRVGCDGSVLDTQYQHLIGDMRRGHRVGGWSDVDEDEYGEDEYDELDGDE
ncbi:hypothetical protein [Gordonia sp. (in: high G+C Gram-positive bacteria)]|uniref:hypothetical protein n=1 Tax=Gordonia sp. (in: high G+C Gram-positive bacteria) TaxID=84139 RepID=UPI002C6A6307|nr:hypothetical protein [Gordonia sp. (in: high G+C Gram-positive bacteria)]HNP56087.1 hypothetical protein [Gordonia sp. (in: high G+C Gram-positive bacteria)]